MTDPVNKYLIESLDSISARVDGIENMLIAHQEAINYAIKISGTYNSQDGIDFLTLWNNGKWPEIKTSFPDFLPNAPAHLAYFKKFEMEPIK